MKVLFGIMLAVLAVSNLPQPQDAKRFYTQTELQYAQIYRREPGSWVEAPGSGGAGAGSGDAAGASSCQ